MTTLPEADYPAVVKAPIEYVPEREFVMEMPVTDSTDAPVDWSGVSQWIGTLRPAGIPPYSPVATVRLPFDVTCPDPTTGLVVLTLPAERTALMDGPDRRTWVGTLDVVISGVSGPINLLEFTLQRRGGVWGPR